MKETPSLLPLPPLSVQALHDLHDIEDVVAEALKDLNEFFPSITRMLHHHNSPKRIERVLRTCLVAHLDVQMNHYSSLPQYRPIWIVQIIGSSIGSLLGLFPVFVDAEQYRGVLQQTAAEHIQTKGLNLPKPKLELVSQKEPPPIEVQQCVAVQLRKLRMECNWSVERLAEVAGFNVRTVARHLSGEVNPHLRNISAYERVFSKQLKRQVVINKMP